MQPPGKSLMMRLQTASPANASHHLSFSFYGLKYQYLESLYFGMKETSIGRVDALVIEWHYWLSFTLLMLG